MDETSAKEILHIDERYRDVTLIAERGLATAYSASDSITGDRVFLKILRESKVGDPHAFQLFCREPALLQSIAREESHLRVPQILSSGYWKERPYFTQPLLDGWSLDKPLRQRVRLSANSVYRIVEDCLKFLVSLNDAEIIHGDISPDNIFIESNEPIPTDGSLPADFSLLLLDYNSARRANEPTPDTSKRQFVFLKLPYAAPELARGLPTSVQSDFYSLGVTMFELLVGTRPYRDPKSMADVRLLRVGSIPRMPDALGVPPPIEHFVRRLLSIDPKQRFDSASDCLSMLLGFNQVGPWLAQTTSSNSQPYHLPQSGVHFVTGSTSQSVPEPVLSEVGPITVHVPELPVERSTYRPPQDWGSRKSDIPDTDTYAPTNEYPIGSYPGDINEEESFKSSDEVCGAAVVSAVHTVPVPITEEEGSSIDLVDFSIFAPASVKPSSSFILELWAYLRSDQKEALTRASKQGRMIERGSRGPVHVPGRSELTIVLRLDGFDLQDSQDTILWTSEITNLAFIVSVPKDMAAGDYPGQISILHNGMLLTRVVFEITVGQQLNEQINLRTQRQELKSAFASYASVDRDEVLRCVQGIQATGVEVFVDVLSLRSGADWETELYSHIRSRDIFYLFWSNAARESEWVSREWHYALEKKGLDFIHPIPLAPPDQVPPPEELQSKHFNDIILACLKSQRVASMVG